MPEIPGVQRGQKRTLPALGHNINFLTRLPLLALLSLGIFAAPLLAQAPDLDTMAQRTKPCAACHGAEGRAAADGYYPRIAGKPAGYLYNQLLHFRDGRRQHAVMSYMVDRQRDAYLREIADYFADLDLPYPPPAAVAASPAQLERGRTLALHGDRKLQLPACRSCHGERLTGIAPALPGLLGLPRDYLLAQFGAWKIGSRQGWPPDCMGRIAAQLGAADTAAVTAWLASQPVPPDAQPSAAPPQALPLDCGLQAPHEGAR